MTDFFTSLYKEIYEKELERKSKVNDSINLIIGVISGFIAAIFYFVISFDFGLNFTINLFFVTCLTITIILIGISIYFMVKASIKLFSGYEYMDLPYPAVLDNHFQELQKYYEENSEFFEDYKSNKDFVKQKFQEYLLNTHKQITDYNVRINDERYELIFYSKKILIFSLIGMIACTALFSTNFFIKQKNPLEPNYINML